MFLTKCGLDLASYFILTFEKRRGYSSHKTHITSENSQVRGLECEFILDTFNL